MVALDEKTAARITATTDSPSTRDPIIAAPPATIEVAKST
jgi:hypothetical protein